MNISGVCKENHHEHCQGNLPDGKCQCQCHEYVCHSGGCPGADMTWKNECDKYGIKTISYSFYNHVQQGKNRVILSVKELDEGFEHVKIASVGLKRNPNCQYPYVRNLLCRNWFQVKNSDAVYAVGKFEDSGRVSGGTGWAVQMAIDNKKPVYFFDQTPLKYDLSSPKYWMYFDYSVNIFIPMTICPKITKNFAGVGTRDINGHGKFAIQLILDSNFK
jgi:hypothetical protein